MEVIKKRRILVAKPGLDGHDRGAKIIAHALKDNGFEVIYTGLHQTVEQIVYTAIQESVDIIGLSIMSGSHVDICENIFSIFNKQCIKNIFVIVGGVIPNHDIPTLKALGVRAVFPNGSFLKNTIKKIKQICPL